MGGACNRRRGVAWSGVARWATPLMGINGLAKVHTERERERERESYGDYCVNNDYEGDKYLVNINSKKKKVTL